MLLLKVGLICVYYSYSIGISEEIQWEKTYAGPVGNIINVNSELGEPIHKIANRGVRFWKEMDNLIFSLPRDKRLAELLKRKDYIVQKLNSDYQKPWFGRKENGQTCDLQEMTYQEVANRLLSLLFINHESKWIDPTLRDVFGDFLGRVECRFAQKKSESLISSYETLDQSPKSVMDAVLESYPESRTQLLMEEDVLYFISICDQPSRKPVPFIPVLDERFDFWFKKDSLWQSENLDAVPDQDAERVAILQGPVAVKYSTIVDEPVKNILDDIYHGQIKAILDRYYEGDVNRVPDVEYLGSVPDQNLGDCPFVNVRHGQDRTLLTVSPSELPETSAFHRVVSSTGKSWIRALISSSAIVQANELTPNFFKKILKPRKGHVYAISFGVSGEPTELRIFRPKDTKPAISIQRRDQLIVLILYEPRDGSYLPLKFEFRYIPSQFPNMIHEVMEVFFQTPVDIIRIAIRGSSDFMLPCGT